jgi:hypothetical protein
MGGNDFGRIGEAATAAMVGLAKLAGFLLFVALLLLGASVIFFSLWLFRS